MAGDQTTARQRKVLVVVTAALTTWAFNALIGRLLAQGAREQAALRAAHADALRLDGTLLAARTMQHHLNNRLAITAGFAELLANDTRLLRELRPMAVDALEGARNSAGLLRQIGRITRLEQDDRRGDTSSLDLERSIGEPSHTPERSGRTPGPSR